MKVTTRMLGDTGEHYALSQFTLAGFPASKMPDNWEGYDLAVEAGNGLVRVSVKSRQETKNGKRAAGFNLTTARCATGWSSCLSRRMAASARG